jgi:hypothetical protein
MPMHPTGAVEPMDVLMTPGDPDPGDHCIMGMSMVLTSPPSPSSPPKKVQKMMNLDQGTPSVSHRPTLIRDESREAASVYSLDKRPLRTLLTQSVFTTVLRMNDSQFRELARHRAETLTENEEEPPGACYEERVAGRARCTRSFTSGQTAGQTVYASTSKAPADFEISTIVDCCEPDQWPDQPRGQTFLAVLWKPVTPSGHAEITWEEASELIRSMGKDGLTNVNEHLRYLYEVRVPYTTASRTLLGFDNPWMPAEDRHPEHNYGHDLSAMFSP